MLNYFKRISNRLLAHPVYYSSDLPSSRTAYGRIHIPASIFTYVRRQQ